MDLRNYSSLVQQLYKLLEESPVEMTVDDFVEELNVEPAVIRTYLGRMARTGLCERVSRGRYVFNSIVGEGF